MILHMNECEWSGWDIQLENLTGKFSHMKPVVVRTDTGDILTHATRRKFITHEQIVDGVKKWCESKQYHTKVCQFSTGILVFYSKEPIDPLINETVVVCGVYDVTQRASMSLRTFYVSDSVWYPVKVSVNEGYVPTKEYLLESALEFSTDIFTYFSKRTLTVEEAEQFVKACFVSAGKSRKCATMSTRLHRIATYLKETDDYTLANIVKSVLLDNQNVPLRSVKGNEPHAQRLLHCLVRNGFEVNVQTLKLAIDRCLVNES